MLQPPENLDELISKFLDEAENINLLEEPFRGMSNSEIATLFIKSRKYDVKRALQLYKDHLVLRKSENLLHINPIDNNCRRELISGKFSILRSKENNPCLAVFRESCNQQNYNWTNYAYPIKSLIFQLDIAIRDQSIQNNGLIVVYNMSQASYNKFDFDLCSRVLKLLKGKYPARLKNVLVMNAPIWFRAPYNILKLFVSEKMRKRISFVDSRTLKNYLSEDLVELLLSSNEQSQLENHIDWLKYCFSIYEVSSLIPDDYFHLRDSDKLNNSSSSNNNNGSNKLIHSWTNRLSRRMSMPFNGDGESRTFSSSGQNQRKFDYSTPPASKCPMHLPPLSNGKATTLVRGNPINMSMRNRRVSDSISNGSGNTICGDDTAAGSKDASIFEKFRCNGRKIEEFVEFMKSINSFEIIGQEFMYEFAHYSDNLTSYFEFSLPRNKSKNRYSDVVCLDNNRVILSDNKYIHANYVDSFKQKNAYICCQGPLEHTIVDFYQMIFETRSPIVVMTTRELEGKTKKCANYLPSETNPIRSFGSFRVSLIIGSNSMQSKSPSEKNINCIKLKHIKIENIETKQIHEFWHYHFLDWPDFGVPNSANDFVCLIEFVHAHYKSILSDGEHRSYPPIIVHCSAGIGRSGTFINVSVNIKWAEQYGKVNLKETLRLIRTQRAGAVQMPQQYIFCHVALLHFLEKTRGIKDF